MFSGLEWMEDIVLCSKEFVGTPHSDQRVLDAFSVRS